MKYLVFVQPFGLQHLVMSNFIRIIVRKVRKNEVTLDIRIIQVLSKTILILPFVLVHSKSERPITHLFLSRPALLPISPLMLEEAIIGIVHPFILLEESSSIQFLYFGRIGLHEVDIVLLLLSGVFEDLILTQVIRQLPESIVITSSEAPLNEIFFFVGIVIEH